MYYYQERFEEQIHQVIIRWILSDYNSARTTQVYQQEVYIESIE